MEAWAITPVSQRIRIAKATFPLVISFGFAVWGWWAQYENNALTQNWYVLLILPAAGTWVAYQIYRVTAKKELTYVLEAIPIRVRILRSTMAFAAVFILCGIAWSMQYSSDQLFNYWWYVWPVAVPGLGWALFELFHSYKKVLVPEAQVEKTRLDADENMKLQAAAQRAAEREDRWYFRYPMAALMVFGSYWVIANKENLWWLSVLLILVAVFQVRELALLIIAGVIIYLLFQGVAALPVSIAIIIGAIIIASALRR